MSVLHQRADAANRAFNRADALVSLAQSYLRGDRPNHSPIEITLTIPASSLRPDTEDPVEVGELGESFLYAEDYHQQDLGKNPRGYCGLGGTGVSCPIGLGAASTWPRRLASAGSRRGSPARRGSTG